MPIYFAFTDECGDYKDDRNKRFLKIHPYYVRGTFIMLAEEWKNLNDRFIKLKTLFDLPRHKEIKWSYAWSLMKIKRNGEEIDEDDKIYFLRKHDYKDLVNFYDEALKILNNLTSVKIILTYTENKSCSWDEKRIYRFHFEDILPRIEMEMQNDDTNLCVLYCDPVDEVKNKMFRDIYHEMFRKGKIIDKYSHIKDSLNIEFSHHSVGIQLADYISGSFNGFLKEYHDSVRIFNNRIKPLLRRDSLTNRISGYGIKEVPSNNTIRIDTIKKMNKYVSVIKKHT